MYYANAAEMMIDAKNYINAIEEIGAAVVFAANIANAEEMIACAEEKIMDGVGNA